MRAGAALSSESGSELLISASYRELNRRLHEINPDYGISGRKYVARVLEMMAALGSRDVLDYGCGKRTLEAALGFPIANYDPAIAEFAAAPQPHDIVVCTDVLEHIEPACIDSVLSDLRRVTKRAAFITIDQRPATKTLEDGRNAHLIVQGQRWWINRLWDRGFAIRALTDTGNRIKAILS